MTDQPGQRNAPRKTGRGFAAFEPFDFGAETDATSEHDVIS